MNNLRWHPSGNQDENEQRQINQAATVEKFCKLFHTSNPLLVERAGQSDAPGLLLVHKGQILKQFETFLDTRIDMLDTL